jgi:predicted ATPase
MKVAGCMLGEFTDGGWLVELASLSDPALVASTVASEIPSGLRSGNIGPESVAHAIAAKKILLLLDNCEHLIGAVATLVETILTLCPNVTILATSREAINIQGEYVYRVPPLEVPAVNHMEPAHILGHSAPELFITRARELGADFSSDVRCAPMVAAICRHLDGIPLAIEFAAARAATLGIEQVAVGLRDRFALLTGGRRTALARHRTLRATLDWSYELLPEREQRLLCRLGVFAGGFTLEAAAAVVGDETGDIGPSLSESVANLVAKSLVVFDVAVPQGRWRLLETIRAYVNEKLLARGEAAAVGRRHAEYFRDFFALLAESAVPSEQDIARYAREMDNARAALDWAFSPSGSPEIGVSLTVGAVPLWMHLSLLEECRGAVMRALANVSARRNGDARLEMRLQAALGASLAWVGGAVPEIEAAWERTLQLAECLGDVDHQLRALWGLWLLRDRQALALAQQFCAVAVTPADQLLGDRMMGVSHHYLGHQVNARRHIERVVADDLIRESGSRIIRFQIDQRSAARAFHARILWLQGFPDQAMEVAESLVEHAREADHANSLCHATAIAACRIAVWVGNLERCEYFTDLLRDYSGRHTLALWRAFGRAYQGVVSIKRGNLQAGLTLLRTGLDEFGPAFAGYRILIFLIELAEALGRDGHVLEGYATINEAADRCERTAEQWIIPELLRIKGELTLLQAAPGASATAHMLFQQAVECARGQGALSWELRAAASLATLHRTLGRYDEAIACLRPVYHRFTEGFDTADLIAAKQLLYELSDADRR